MRGTKDKQLKNRDMDEIIKVNKLIAEFMGWRFIKWCGEEDETKLPMYQRFENDVLVHPGIFHEPDYQDWNSIMPVVEKICEIDNQADEDFSTQKGYRDLEIFKTSILCHKDAVYSRVIQFVQWFNTQKQSI